jgi:lactate dehydrogenase-like 2-hydroxyacid dehydrogenase
MRSVPREKDGVCGLSQQVLPSANREQVKMELPQMIAYSGQYDAFIIRMGTHPYEPFDEDLLGALVPGCKLIASASAGYNEFDVNWMTRSGIWFCNTRNAVSEATADMTIFLILAILKDASRAARSARSGKWRADHVPTRDPSGLKLGILGMGAIGKHVAKKASVFNLDVQYHNRTQLPSEVEAEYRVSYCSSLQELLSTSDIISVNCPLNDATTGMISTKEFAAMKDGVFFVNTARGAIVDEKALIAALESGKIARAGLDVFDDEPKINPYFLQSEQCCVQPHLGGLTDVAFQKAERECFENIRAFFRTGQAISPVNEIA